MSANVPPKLKKMAERIHKGERPTETPRTIMGWFEFQRRTSGNAAVMSEALAEVRLTTEPDFLYAFVDSPVAILPVTGKAVAAIQPAAVQESDVHDAAVDATPLATGAAADPTYRIGKLPAANNPPLRIGPDKPLSEATTLMLAHDYSQLPVMLNERTVKGIISWKSIGTRMSLGHRCEYVRDCMDTCHEISSDLSIFGAAKQIIDYEAVLVRDSRTQVVCGIVTTTDLGLAFNQLGEPFLLIGEIENHVRRLIDGKYSIADLGSVIDPASRGSRTVTKVSDLTFGEYVRLLENTELWKKATLKFDRVMFVKELEDIRRIRNDTMHFDPDGLGTKDIETLRRFLRFLQRVAEVQPAGAAA